MKKLVLLIALAALFPLSALAAGKSCEELKSELAAKLDAKGVKGYTLTIVKAEEVKDAKVVGSCAAGTQKIVYERK